MKPRNNRNRYGFLFIGFYWIKLALLAGLHAGAALFHHYFLRDSTLRRMLPGP